MIYCYKKNKNKLIKYHKRKKEKHKYIYVYIYYTRTRRRKLVCLLHKSTTKIYIYLSCLLFPFHLIGNVIIQMCTFLIYLYIYICFIISKYLINPYVLVMICRPNFHLEIQKLRVSSFLNRHLYKFVFQCYSLPILFWLGGDANR